MTQVLFRGIRQRFSTDVRLGPYRYLDMDVTTHEALTTPNKFLACAKDKSQMLAFVVNPLG